jgi:hypothetical protein
VVSSLVAIFVTWAEVILFHRRSKNLPYHVSEDTPIHNCANPRPLVLGAIGEVSHALVSVVQLRKALRVLDGDATIFDDPVKVTGEVVCLDPGREVLVVIVLHIPLVLDQCISNEGLGMNS